MKRDESTAAQEAHQRLPRCARHDFDTAHPGQVRQKGRHPAQAVFAHQVRRAIEMQADITALHRQRNNHADMPAQDQTEHALIVRRVRV